jgi:glycosyltransferase involved in cell wall biosynthesis
MLKVAFSDRTMHRNVGGNSTYVRALHSRLPAQGVVYEPCSFLPRVQHPLVEAFGEGVVLPLRARRNRSDVVHFPTDTGGLPLLHAAGKPVVATVHGLASAHVPSVRTTRAEAMWRSRVRMTVSVAREVITVSTTSADDLMTHLGVSAQRIHVIHHGIDHDRFNVTGRRRAHFPSLPQRYLLYLGNLDPRKNVGSLLRAFDTRLARRHDIALVVAGRHAWGCHEVVREMQERADVLYLGPVPDSEVAPLMRGAMGFVFPSLYEGFGFPVLEALACGVPVAATARGSLGEVAGDVVVRIDDPTPSGIRTALEELLSNGSADGRAEAGVAHASKFTWARSAAAHAEVFWQATA